MRSLSHTSISLWNLCKRRWYYYYVIGGERVPAGDVAAFSTHMVHNVIEDHERGLDIAPDLDLYWQRYKEAMGEQWDDAHEHHEWLNIKTASKILASWRTARPSWTVSAVEARRELALVKGADFVSIPDLIVDLDNHHGCATVDFKLVTSTWPSPQRPWPIKPLSPFDDQLLGQAIASNAERFIRVTFQLNRKNGAVAEPIIEEIMVDELSAQEWRHETKAVAMDIRTWLKRGPHSSWPKNTDACYAFGRECPYFKACKNGFQAKGLNDATRES